jgi:hypothetical protein
VTYVREPRPAGRRIGGMTQTSRFGLAAITVCALAATVSTQDWNAADRATRRLPPAFPEIPKSVRMELERRGCTIPQTSGSTRPENIIKGHFTSHDRVDWAALCSVRRTSTILVFRGGSAQSVSALASSPDVGFLQTLGFGAIGFSRLIEVADKKFIEDHHRAYGGPKPPLIDHEGIDDVYVEKASSVRYWYRGRWLTLQGSD